MAYRKKMSRSSSRKNFKKGANRLAKKNVPTTSMRGGHRL